MGRSSGSGLRGRNLPHESGLLIGHVNIHARGDEKSLAHRAAVDMHFLIVVPIRLDVEHHRRESGRYRSRRDQNMTNEIESAGVVPCGDGSDIPQNRSPWSRSVVWMRRRRPFSYSDAIFASMLSST